MHRKLLVVISVDFSEAAQLLIMWFLHSYRASWYY